MISRFRLVWLSLWALAFAATAQAPAAPFIPAPHATPPAAPASASVLAPTPLNSDLSGELMYQLLVGELSLTTGDPGAGYSIILDAARKTNDSKLFQRAMDIALQARSGDSALQAARAWQAAQPASREANRFFLQILLGLNRTQEVAEPLQRELAFASGQERTAVILGIPRYFARASDKAASAQLVEKLLTRFVAEPSSAAAAWTAIGRMRGAAADLPGALEAARRAQASDPAFDGAALLAVNLMSSKVGGAEAIVLKYLEGPSQPEVRLDYARVLLDMQRYAEAATQLRTVVAERPTLAQPWLILGSIDLQDDKLDAAEKSLLRYIELVPPTSSAENTQESAQQGLTQAFRALAQIAEQRRDFAQAESWLNRIVNADDLISAQGRRASLMARQGQLDKARELVRNLAERSPADARLKTMIEVQLLRDAKQFKAAYELLSKATEAFPQDYDMLYDKAMLSEKLGNLPEMERLLREVMTAKPDYHHAYNALGFSLAERNLRLGEARQLIQKALEFAPNDPFIKDSLGWVEFRIGNTEQAVRILESAYAQKPDTEIAAHLGEVLWSLGRRDQALAIWREGQRLNSDNETMRETLKRLRVKP